MCSSYQEQPIFTRASCHLQERCLNALAGPLLTGASYCTLIIHTEMIVGRDIEIRKNLGGGGGRKTQYWDFKNLKIERYGSALSPQVPHSHTCEPVLDGYLYILHYICILEPSLYTYDIETLNMSIHFCWLFYYSYLCV